MKKNLDTIIKEAYHNAINKIKEEKAHTAYINEIEDMCQILNNPKSMSQAFISEQLGNIIKTEKNILYGDLNEGVDWDIPNNEKGGIITFATSINAVDLHPNKFLNALKKKALSIKQYLTSNKQVDNVAKKMGLVGLTIGHFLTGKYVKREVVDNEVKETIFDDSSLSLEIVGVTFEKLMQTAEELCIEFKQDSVLVKSYETGKIMFVYNDELRKVNNKYWKLNK